MNATKCINTTTKFPSSHSDPNFHRTELAFFVEVAATPLTFNTTITNSNNNCLSFQTTSGNGGSLANNPWQQAKISTSREYSRATAQSTTLPTTATKTAATMTLLDKEMSASDDEDTSKLMPAAIRFININNNNNNKNNSSNNNKCYGISSNNSCSSHNNRNKSNSDSHVQASSYNSDNNNSTNDISNINKSTSKSTATTTTTTTTSGAKLASSKFINSRNKLMTATTTHMRQQQQQQQQEHTEQQQQNRNDKMLSITRDLNQINLKSSSLYANQQLYNDHDNNSNQLKQQQQQQQQQQREECDNLSTNVNSSKKNNNKYNNKQQQQGEEATKKYNNNSSCNNNNKDDSTVNDNSHNNSDKLAQVNKMENMKSSNKKNNESIELAQQQQQQLVAAAKLNLQLEKIAVVSEKININAAATKVRVETPTTAATTNTTTLKIQAIERAKTSKLTLRKSNSTPASFKIGDVAAAAAAVASAGKSISSNNNNDIKLFLNVSQSRVAETKVNEELKNYNKNDSDAAGYGDGDGDGDYDVSGDDGDGNVGGGEVCKCTAAIRVKFAPTLTHTRALKLTNAPVEAISTKTITQTAAAATTIETTTTTKLASIKPATMDVVMRAPSAAQVSQQLQQQYEQQQPQQQQQLTNAKSAKAKDNDYQVIRGIKSSTGGVSDVVVVASTTTMPIASHNPLPLPNAVNFDLDLRFGCAHYKRRAMFVTPCCNKFYKCRFCHDENESHHFDRKTLTELICSECNTRQKVQEQCEACGTRFGKYTCLICNLFDDTDKKQYHCNGCGICRIGGAENFFHCEVCDMCLPIRLKIDGHRCVENISRSHCPVCLGDIHTSRIPCHIPDCGHLLHKTCFDQLLNSGHYTCPICQTSLIDMTALWEYLDAQAVSLPVPKKYENQRIHIFCNDCHKTSKTKFNFIGLKCMQCGAYNTTQDVKRRMSLVADEPSSA